MICVNANPPTEMHVAKTISRINIMCFPLQNSIVHLLYALPLCIDIGINVKSIFY